MAKNLYLKWMLTTMITAFFISSHCNNFCNNLGIEFAESSRLLADPQTTTNSSTGRSLLQTCSPGMRLNCPSDSQVECEVGGGGGCSCSELQACLPEVSGCFLVVNGVATTSCGF